MQAREIEYTTYKQVYKGTERIIYRANVGKATIEAGSLERLTELVVNHKDITQGTFKTS
jgi:hypothetical protein